MTVNTDNRLITDTTLTKELLLAHREMGFTLEDLCTVLVQGFKSAFLPFREKQDLLRAVNAEIAAVLSRFGAPAAVAGLRAAARGRRGARAVTARAPPTARPVGVLSLEASDEGVLGVSFGDRGPSRPGPSARARAHLEAAERGAATTTSPGRPPRLPALDAPRLAVPARGVGGAPARSPGARCRATARWPRGSAARARRARWAAPTTRNPVAILDPLPPGGGRPAAGWAATAAGSS